MMQVSTKVKSEGSYGHKLQGLTEPGLTDVGVLHPF